MFFSYSLVHPSFHLRLCFFVYFSRKLLLL